MKASVNHAKYGLIEYEEGLWTGKKTLAINGVNLTKKKKNTFIMSGSEGELVCTISGNVFTGICVNIAGDIILLITPLKWYEIALTVIIPVFILTWGNSTTLCAIFPIIGGGIGGALGGLGACINLSLMKKINSLPLKILAWLGTFAATVIVCFIAAIIFIVCLSALS